MSLLIKNGTVVTAVDEYQADVLVDGERISAIGKNLDGRADEVVDATGLLVLPGGVDQHTHFNFTFKTATVRGFEHSNAALAGGTTTIVDFANQEMGKSLRESIERYNEEKAAPKAMCDYGFHGVVFDPNEALFKEIRKLPEFGVPTLKLFMAYKGMPYHCDDDSVFKALQVSKESGVTIMVHAENADVIDVLQKQCLADGKVDPIYHAVSRPPIVETEATQRAICLAEAAGAPLFVVHVTAKGAMEAIRDAYARGIPAYGETCTHYLVLETENLAKPKFEGAKYVCSPPLRSREHIDALWEAVEKDWLRCVSSDHCGFDWAKQKHLGKGDFTSIPNGAPGLQDRLQVLWTNGVEKGRITRQRFVQLWATGPARINGLFPRKGTLAVGSDADVLLFDPKAKGIISVRDSLHGVDFDTYEGMEYVGKPVKVYLRGSLVFDKGQFLGKEGQGKFIEGKPYGLAYGK
ncbi:MAG: dihydropyrimidinase [Spirochaetales bacterium]|nr:dihydropyrimidinase [Spirochaetales bacterium]